jgi:aldehyde dehydrogenase (NAD+)
MITEAAAIWVEQWVEQAKAAGARVLLQGLRDGASLAPSILMHVPVDQPIACDEVFGPVVVVESVESFDEGIARINASRFGLQAGVFTYDIRRVLQAHQQLRVGGVIINDVPTFRSDAMPYGGDGDSGTGREGIRWAMDEYTSPRVLVLG